MSKLALVLATSVAAATLFSVSAQASTFDPTVTITAIVKASAKAGVQVDPGKPNNGKASTKEQVDATLKYASQYDGETVFSAMYNINVTKTGDTLTFNPTGSTLQLLTKSFTDNGEVDNHVSKNDGTSPVIPITGATFNANGSIASFTFAGSWYPPKAPTYNLILDKGITGTINLNDMTYMSVAMYVPNPASEEAGGVSDGVFSIYKIDGKFKGAPVPAPPYFGNVTMTPLPSTWTMLIAGFVGLGFFGFHGSKKYAVA